MNTHSSAPDRIGQGVLDDLAERVRSFRRVPTATAGWTGGVDVDYLAALLDHWAERYDWRLHEDRIRALPWVLTGEPASPLRVVHQRSVPASQEVVVLLHGWPDSILRYERLLPLLSDVNAIVPALPGFPFAVPVRDHGLGAEAMAHSVAAGVAELGYERYVVSGGDIGADIAEVLAFEYPERVAALHLTDVSQNHFRLSDDPGDLTEAESSYVEAGRRWQAAEGGYGHEQSTKPSTLSVALGDSPAGLAAWILEKLRSWSDCGGDVEAVFSREDVLTWITAYWVTGCIGTSFAPYAGRTPPHERFAPPTVFSTFGEDILNAPRSYAERFFDVRQFSAHAQGGHFAAWERPAAYAADLRVALSLGGRSRR